MTELLLETPLNKTQREYLKMVAESGDALLDLINDILDFSKIESGKFELEHYRVRPSGKRRASHENPGRSRSSQEFGTRMPNFSGDTRCACRRCEPTSPSRHQLGRERHQVYRERNEQNVRAVGRGAEREELVRTKVALVRCQLSEIEAYLSFLQLQACTERLARLDLNPCKTPVFPSPRVPSLCGPRIRLADIVFQIVRPQPSRQRLQLNDFCSTTCCPAKRTGAKSVADFFSLGRLEPFAACVLRAELRRRVAGREDFPLVCSSP